MLINPAVVEKPARLDVAARSSVQLQAPITKTFSTPTPAITTYLKMGHWAPLVWKINPLGKTVCVDGMFQKFQILRFAYHSGVIISQISGRCDLVESFRVKCIRCAETGYVATTLDRPGTAKDRCIRSDQPELWRDEIITELMLQVD